MNRVNERERKAIKQFRHFARATIQNYVALIAWVKRGRRGIGPTAAAARLRRFNVKAQALVDVAQLASRLPALQQELKALIEERLPAALFFSNGYRSNGERKPVSSSNGLLK
jgi:hypothetical protein